MSQEWHDAIEHSLASSQERLYRFLTRIETAALHRWRAALVDLVAAMDAEIERRGAGEGPGGVT